MRCSRSVRYAPGGPNLPTGGQAWPSVRPRSPFTKAPVSVNGQAGRRPSRTLCMGAGAVGGRRPCGVEGLRGRVSPHSRVPRKPARGSRAVACGFGREMRKDRVQAGPGREWAGVAEGAAGTAAVLWFRVEIVRGRRRRHAVLEAAAPSGFRGKRGRELIVLFVGRRRWQRPLFGSPQPSGRTPYAAESP